MVSPANTNPGLTKKWDPGEPNKYYPTGTRNYARVVATDDIQGPADALWTKSLGIKKVFVLNDKQTYGFGVATTYRSAAKKLGLKVVGFQGWDAKQSSYEALANSIKASGAQAVFLGGIACNNGAKLMQDIKSVNPKIQLQMPDGFSDPGANGAVANGAYISVAGAAAERAHRCRRDVREELRQAGRHGRRTRTPRTAHRRCSSCSRQSPRAAAIVPKATKGLFGLTITNGILGNFTINAAGDTNLTPITIYKQAGKNLNPVKTLVPDREPHRLAAGTGTHDAGGGAMPPPALAICTDIDPVATHAHTEPRVRPRRSARLLCDAGPRGAARRDARPLARASTSSRARRTSSRSRSSGSRTAPCTRSSRSATRSSTASSS